MEYLNIIPKDLFLYYKTQQFNVMEYYALGLEIKLDCQYFEHKKLLIHT